MVTLNLCGVWKSRYSLYEKHPTCAAQANHRGVNTTEGAKSGAVRLDLMKRGRGINGLDDKSSGIETHITDVLTKINPETSRCACRRSKRLKSLQTRPDVSITTGMKAIGSGRLIYSCLQCRIFFLSVSRKDPSGSGAPSQDSDKERRKKNDFQPFFQRPRSSSR